MEEFITEDYFEFSITLSPWVYYTQKWDIWMMSDSAWKMGVNGSKFTVW